MAGSRTIRREAAAGIPAIVELSLMPVTRQWLPVEDGFDKQLVEQLVAKERSFIKGLRYNLGTGGVVASAALTDCEGAAPLLFVVCWDVEDKERYREAGEPAEPVWLWHPSSEAMPALPPRQSHKLRSIEAAIACR